MNEIDQLIAQYKISDQALAVVRSTRIALLVGITAAGKDTLQNQLLKRPIYHEIITHTTRPPRANNGVMEVDGQNYHFVSVEQMSQLLKNQQLIEVNRFGDNYYGTSVGEFEAAKAADKIALGDIDVHGIASFRALSEGNVVPIFIVPPDYDTWRQRLEKRYQSTEELGRELPKRLAAAQFELEHALSVPYYHFIINDELERAVRVADKIASGENSFNQRDEEARAAAANLLNAINAHL